jgi:NAD(P)-dependent dehydrogenase (short-subunit alcohol dehydrogenase family)
VIPIADTASAGVGIVTGGASGIGWAVTQLLRSEGWSIAVFDIDEELGRRCLEGRAADSISFRPVDVRDRALVEREVEAVWSRFGRLDLWCCAGVAGRGLDPQRVSDTDQFVETVDR